jgi:multiple sugar transport system ATP-binding protein
MSPENMSYSLKLRKTAKEKITSAVSAAAAKLGLDPLLDRRPKALSGGQRQRVAMGRAIVRQPKAFLFDEPLSNLDARLREQMRAEIKKLHGDLKATSIYVTHDQIEAMTLADRIVAMHGGVVQQVGSPLELYDRPANLFVAGFIGSPGMNFLDATYQAGSVTLKDGTVLALEKPLELADGAKVTLGIRPEHVVMSPDGNGMSANVELVEPTGFGIILHLSLHGLPFKIFTLNREALSAGPKVKVSFPAQYLHVFDGEGKRAG